MSKLQSLRALVAQRLAAAAEDILALFEETMAEYEENQRSPRTPDTALPGLLQPCGGCGPRAAPGLLIPPPSPGPGPGPGLNQDLFKTVQIKEEPEEQSVKQEDDPLPLRVPEASAVCVKREESKQSLYKEETRAYEEDVSAEPPTERSDTDWDPAADGAQTRDARLSPSALDTRAHSGHPPGAHSGHPPGAHNGHPPGAHNGHPPGAHSGHPPGAHNGHPPGAHSGHPPGAHNGHPPGAERQHQCPFCQKRFLSKQCLQIHRRVHTGERPYTCPVCSKAFTQKGNLNTHMSVHAARSTAGPEKKHQCCVCKKRFGTKCNLEMHMRVHTGERPYNCPVCSKTFNRKFVLDRHLTTQHQGAELRPPPAPGRTRGSGVIDDHFSDYVFI